MPANAALADARAWLDHNLFPDAPAPPAFTWRRMLVGFGVALALVAVQLTRIAGSAPLNSIWAEDGFKLLADAIHRSFFAAVTTPYAGYLQTSSRLIAEPLAWLPVARLAAAMALAGAAVVTGCAFVVWRASAGHIQTPYLRATLAGLVVLLPVYNVEMLGNVTNSIWLLMFVSFWLLLWRPATLGRAIAAAGLLLLAALSTAGVLLMFPVWLLRAVSIRDRRDGVIVGAFAVGSAVQLGVLVAGKPATTPKWEWSLVPAYAQRVVGGAFTGGTVTGDLWKQIGTPFELILAIALVAFVTFALLGTDTPSRLVVPLAVAVSLVAFLVSGYERDLAPVLLWPSGASNSLGSRYVVAPTLILLSALFVSLDVRPRFVSGTVWAGLRAGATMSVLVLALLSFDISDRAQRGSQTWSAALDYARAECALTHVATEPVPVAPPVFGFSIPLACSKMAG